MHFFHQYNRIMAAARTTTTTKKIQAYSILVWSSASSFTWMMITLCFFLSFKLAWRMWDVAFVLWVVMRYAQQEDLIGKKEKNYIHRNTIISYAWILINPEASILFSFSLSFHHIMTLVLVFWATVNWTVLLKEIIVSLLLVEHELMNKMKNINAFQLKLTITTQLTHQQKMHR